MNEIQAFVRSATDDLISALCLVLVCLNLSRGKFSKKSEPHELPQHHYS